MGFSYGYNMYEGVVGSGWSTYTGSIRVKLHLGLKKGFLGGENVCT